MKSKEKFKIEKGVPIPPKPAKNRIKRDKRKYSSTKMQKDEFIGF